MIIKSEAAKYLSLVVLIVAFFLFVYGTYEAIKIVMRTQIGTSKGIYTSYVTTDEEIKSLAHQRIKSCDSKLCKVQKLLDYTSNIPYKTNRFQQKSPQKTIKENFGDCDDKSNLLISMLHAVGIDAYFVLVPKHIFVIVALEDTRLKDTKGLWVNGTKYYILESTAKNSKVGYALKYQIDEIDVIFEPFENKVVEIKSLSYKL